MYTEIENLDFIFYFGLKMKIFFLFWELLLSFEFYCLSSTIDEIFLRKNPIALRLGFNRYFNNFSNLSGVELGLYLLLPGNLAA